MRGTNTSAIHTLPIELLSYIFTLSTHSPSPCPDSNDSHRPPPFNTDSVKAPLHLSCVNRHWRRVALDTPGLWTSLCVTLEMIEVWDTSLLYQEDRLELEYNEKAIPKANANLKTKTSTVSAVGMSVLNKSHLLTYLALSRNYPLDILIDARDQDWDFFEPEIPSEYGGNNYTPPFSTSHMKTVISILLPHISRWRSLSIFTDSWAPMYTALTCINPTLTTFGAPRLESLTLMRCNDFVSYAPEFQPAEMREPAFLKVPASSSGGKYRNILPKLQHLTLRGVHADWTSLGAALALSRKGLRTLEMSSHCTDVRPSLYEFHHILSSCPDLEELAITGSGPYIPESEDITTPSSLYHQLNANINPNLNLDVDMIVNSIDHNLEPVPLQSLRQLTVGYRSSAEAQLILGLVHAHGVKALNLEDATYPGDTEDVDSSPLMRFLGNSLLEGSDEVEEAESDEKYLVAYQVPDLGLTYQVALGSTHKSSTTTNSSSGETSTTLFPSLRQLSLRNVKSCVQPIRGFLYSLKCLEELEFSGMSMGAVHALFPSLPSTTMDRCQIPCPQLHALSIKNIGILRKEDVEFLLEDLPNQRRHGGSSEPGLLKEVDVYVDTITFGDSSPSVERLGAEFGAVVQEDEDSWEFRRRSGSGSTMRVKVFKQNLSESSPSLDDADIFGVPSGDEDEYEYGGGYEEDPMEVEAAFKVGGVFNDPVFDAYYSSRSFNPGFALGLGVSVGQGVYVR